MNYLTIFCLATLARSANFPCSSAKNWSHQLCPRCCKSACHLVTQRGINASFCVIDKPKFASFLWNHEQTADRNGLWIMFVIKHLLESARVTDNWKHIIPQWSMPLMLLTSRFMLMTHLRALTISKTGCWKLSAVEILWLSTDDRNLWNQIFFFFFFFGSYSHTTDRR